jgi:hypothetical protein
MKYKNTYMRMCLLSFDLSPIGSMIHDTMTRASAYNDAKPEMKYIPCRDQRFPTYKLRICEIRAKIPRLNHFRIRTLIFPSVKSLSDSVHYHKCDIFRKKLTKFDPWNQTNNHLGNLLSKCSDSLLPSPFNGCLGFKLPMLTVFSTAFKWVEVKSSILSLSKLLETRLD